MGHVCASADAPLLNQGWVWAEVVLQNPLPTTKTCQSSSFYSWIGVPTQGGRGRLLWNCWVSSRWHQAGLS